MDAQAKRGPVDLLLANGDLIDGRGERSGSSELIATDRVEQTDMAIECLRKWNAKHVLLTYGTAYHTGKIEDWEDRVAERLGAGAEIAGKQQVDVGGVVFNARHHIGSSAIPHGRATASARESLWNRLLAAEGQEAKADIILRSHVHYHSFCGGPGWLAMTLPALQGAGSKYGRRCTGAVHWGITWFETENGELKRWKAETRTLKCQVSEAKKIS